MKKRISKKVAQAQARNFGVFRIKGMIANTRTLSLRDMTQHFKDDEARKDYLKYLNTASILMEDALNFYIEGTK